MRKTGLVSMHPPHSFPKRVRNLNFSYNYLSLRELASLEFCGTAAKDLATLRKRALVPDVRVYNYRTRKTVSLGGTRSDQN